MAIKLRKNDKASWVLSKEFVVDQQFRHYTPYEERDTPFVDEFQIFELRSSNLTNQESERESKKNDSYMGTLWVPRIAHRGTHKLKWIF